MSDLVGNPEDRFSRVAAHIMYHYKFTRVSVYMSGYFIFSVSMTCCLSIFGQKAFFKSLLSFSTFSFVSL